MQKGDIGSVSEIMWLIEERKRRIEDIENQIVSEKDENILRGLKGMVPAIRSELADLECELDLKNDAQEEDDGISSLDDKISDIDAQLKCETDAVVRNNLEVSKRFLQMERNALLIKKTQAEKPRDPLAAKNEELEKLCESRLRLIQDLQARLAKAEKERSFYKAVAENPDRRVNSDTTRVTVTAGALSELRNDAKILKTENETLKAENRALKNEHDILRENIRSLTLVCKESDSRITELQRRLIDTRDSLEKLRKPM